MWQNQLEVVVKVQITRLSLLVSDLVGLRVGLRRCIPSEFPGDANADGMG